MDIIIEEVNKRVKQLHIKQKYTQKIDISEYAFEDDDCRIHRK